MSRLSNYFNTQSAAPSWRLAKASLGVTALSIATVAMSGDPVVSDVAGWTTFLAGGVTIGGVLNGFRKGLTHRPSAPSP